jgi:hypothetical protein
MELKKLQEALFLEICLNYGYLDLMCWLLVIKYLKKNNDLREQIRNNYYGFIDLNNNLLHITSIEISDLQIFTI